jgi:16S rRNA (uracil1498-N3)-methyltransferase
MVEAMRSSCGRLGDAPLPDSPRSFAVYVGPEGDFSPEEIRLAVECGFEEISLGHQRLRTETAAVMATAIISFTNSL